MTIRFRFLLFTALIILLTGLFTWSSVKVITEDIIIKWVTIYAEKQLRYDKIRTLSPLIQEVNLSKEFAQLEPLKHWASNPDDEELKKQALLEAEKFRHRFFDDSYFIALHKNNHYYYNDGKSTPPNNSNYRYILDDSKAEDAWFYSIIEKQIDMHLNVNPDVELGVVKLWFDVLIREDDQILGVVGTGLNLSTFLKNMVEQQDIYSAVIFTNHEGSIQLHQEEELINFASVSKQFEEKSAIFQLLDDEPSKQKLRNSFKKAKEKPNMADMAIVYKDGSRQMASVIYIPEIDWFQVNFININSFLPWSEFSGLFIVFLASLFFALFTFHLLVSLIVTKPLKELDDSISTFGHKQHNKPKNYRFAGLEIKRLIAHYEKMSASSQEYQEKLEKEVAERTAALNKLAQHDSLTGLYNRRGVEHFIEEYMKDWQQKKTPFTIISVDMDHFKKINDQYGHVIGDKVLQKLGHYLQTIMTGNGIAARWGGDEFLVLIQQNDENKLNRIHEQLLTDSTSFFVNLDNQELTITFSLGSAAVQENDTLESLYSRADKIMYKSKFSRKEEQKVETSTEYH